MKTLLTLLGFAALSSTQAQCEAAFRLFDHKQLATEPVCVPERPEHVVVGDFASLDVA